MSSMRPVAMDGVEIDEFLRDHSTGVLALGKGDEGYGIPVSYAYQDDERAVYLRLGYADDSEKRAFVDAADLASFVVYEETDDGWQSVVARGSLEELSESNIDSTVLEAVHELDIPFVTIFEEDRGDLNFRITRLDVEKIDGRKQT